MKFIDFFAGIGGFRLGLEQSGHECVGFCEIDKYAVKSYRAMHDTKGEFYAADITRIQPGDLPEADIYCGGFPCQSFSIAGKRGGFEDTRGTLFFEIMRLAKVRKPKYLFFENVRGLLSHDAGNTYGTILNTMGEFDYDVQAQIINSKNYVPQNRERIFIIGSLRGSGGRKVFPILYGNREIIELQGQQNITNCIKVRYKAGAVGAYVVEREQYAQDKPIRVGGLYDTGGQKHQVGAVYSPDGISPTVDTCTGGNRMPMIIVQPVLTPDRAEKRQNGRRFKENGEDMLTLTAQDKHGVMIKEATSKGYVEASEGDSINLSFPESETRRGRVAKQIAQTLETSCNQGVMVSGLSPTLTTRPEGFKTAILPITKDYRIRRLTPKECFRLQGFPDEYFERAASVNSNSQLYKQAGNSVTIPVIYDIARRL